MVQQSQKAPEIRIFTREDLANVIRVNETCLPENYPPSYYLSIYSQFPKSFLVAIDGDKIIGYIMCKVHSGLSSYRFRWVKKGHIVSIAVSEPYRGQNTGERLLKQALTATTHDYGADEYMLEVRVSNRAVNFYKRLGFIIEKRLKGYYSDGEDGYLMARQSFNHAI